MVKFFGLFGCGGHGRETIPYVQNFKKNEIKFVDDNVKSSRINDIEVLSSENFFKLEADVKYFNVSVANNFERKKISDKFLANDCKPLNLISSTSVVNKYSTINEGSILSEYTYVAPNVKIGKFFHLNRYSQVSHDFIVGDYVTFGPQVSCNGNVHIQDYVYIGSGALIKQGTSSKPLIIGEGAIIGMGAVVTKDVEPNSTVIGNPARLNNRRLIK